MHINIFPKYKNVLAVLSSRQDGNMKLGGAGSSENRRLFLKCIGIDGSKVVSAELAHGNRVVDVNATEGGQVISGVDGLMTNVPGIYLSVTVADCLPVYFFDPVKETVALVHAGWRSLAGGILSNAINGLEKKFQTDAASIKVTIGPGIGSCHFEVGREVIEAFEKVQAVPSLHEPVPGEKDKFFMDLKSLAAMQLEKHGIMEKNINVNPQCTYCQTAKYFSTRRDKPKEVRAMMAVIGLDASQAGISNVTAG